VIADILLAWTDHWGWLWMCIGLLGYAVVVFVSRDA